jgi:hypothetical protein
MKMYQVVQKLLVGDKQTDRQTLTPNLVNLTLTKVFHCFSPSTQACTLKFGFDCFLPYSSQFIINYTIVCYIVSLNYWRQPSGIQSHVVSELTDVSEARTDYSSHWWWRLYIPLKRLSALKLHGAISHEAFIFILAVVRTSNITYSKHRYISYNKQTSFTCLPPPNLWTRLLPSFTF